MADTPDAAPPYPWSQEGEPVPDIHLLISIGTALTKHSGLLTTRRADSMTREIIAREVIAHLRRSGYRITFGPGAPEHGTPAGTAAGAMIKP
ncbi:hypothetical protein CRT60_21725 [Azospirillum palustre]|uniref:Uncharacterized protein n=1 Tax=Azospirillum palustre TaxID=2044885 RepID=A0A2B8B3M2_9PROT|nr:hypothetical protein [Azospirillum palustre]PGH55874.1 hypothetical protein CRT60_21725 [Azospirillum palustre]